MSGKIMGGVWDLELSAPQTMVLLAMADHADHEGNNVYPSMDLIAWKCGYSERQVRRIVNSLVENQVLLKETRPGKTNVFSIHLENGKKKKPFKTNPGQNDTPDIAMSTHPGHFDPPTPDIQMSDEPSLEPSINLKEKRAPEGASSQPVAKVEAAATQPFDIVPGRGNPANPPTSAIPPKPNSKEAKFRTEWIQHEKKGEALLKAFGWLAFTHPSEMTRASLEDYLEAAKQLMNCPVETIPSLHKFVADKAKAGNWSSFGPLSLAKYYPEFQSLKHKPAVMSQAARAFDETPEPPPLTEAQKAEVRAQLAQARALMGAN